MKILAFAATTSSQSINKQLIDYGATILESEGDETSVEVIDLNDFEMPIYSVDREVEGGIPQLAYDFFNKIGEADGVLIAFAEHNGFYTAAYKNLFDWASRIDMRVYQDKPTVMLATSPGGGGGAHALSVAMESAPFFGNDVKASLSVPKFHENFDAEAGKLTDHDLDSEFRTTVVALTESRDEAA